MTALDETIENMLSVLNELIQFQFDSTISTSTSNNNDSNSQLFSDECTLGQIRSRVAQGEFVTWSDFIKVLHLFTQDKAFHNKLEEYCTLFVSKDNRSTPSLYLTNTKQEQTIHMPVVSLDQLRLSFIIRNSKSISLNLIKYMHSINKEAVEIDDGSNWISIDYSKLSPLQVKDLILKASEEISKDC